MIFVFLLCSSVRQLHAVSWLLLCNIIRFTLARKAGWDCCLLFWRQLPRAAISFDSFRYSSFNFSTCVCIVLWRENEKNLFAMSNTRGTWILMRVKCERRTAVPIHTVFVVCNEFSDDQVKDPQLFPIDWIFSATFSPYRDFIGIWEIRCWANHKKNVHTVRLDSLRRALLHAKPVYSPCKCLCSSFQSCLPFPLDRVCFSRARAQLLLCILL